MSGGELPDGWCLSGINEICEKITDGTHFSPKVQGRAGAYKYVTAKNIREWGLDLSDVTYVSEAVHRPIFERCNPEKGDVLYIKDGATAGVAIVNPLDEEFSLLSSVALLKTDRSRLDPSFLKWYLTSPIGKKAMLDQVTGSAITRLTLEIIRSSEIPFPPLAEQKRIVAKVEVLVAHVDAGRHCLARVLAILKRFRQAVLAAACDGTLTEDWRDSKTAPSIPATGEPEGALPESWSWSSGAQLFRWGSGKFLPKSQQRVGRFPIYGGNGVAGYHTESLTARPTLVIGRVGALCGNIHLTPGPAWVTDNAIYASEVSDGIDLRYIAWVYAHADLNANAGGSGQPFVSQQALNEVRVPLPPKEEQLEIVRRVEALFKVADGIEARVTAATARADRLTQAILAKAFRGELAPTEAELARREERAKTGRSNVGARKR